MGHRILFDEMKIHNAAQAGLIPVRVGAIVHQLGVVS
jgi:hypothetical protein